MRELQEIQKMSPKAYAEDIIYERFGKDKFLVVWMKENQSQQIQTREQWAVRPAQDLW